MRSQTRSIFSGIPSLILEGIAIDPSLHGKGIYGRLLSEIYEGETILCLRTQNPRVYAALEKYCRTIYPKEEETPKAIQEIQKSFAESLRCQIDENGVVKGYYGNLFYGTEPLHARVSPFFKERLKMDLHKGDAVLVIGVK